MAAGRAARLLELVMVLVAAGRQGLSKQELFEAVDDYAESEPGLALEKKFQRDVEELRELGIPLETEDADGTGRGHRWRIVDGPSAGELELEPQELALLEAAALAWREGALTAQSERSLAKLRALGVDAVAPTHAASARLRARERAFEPVAAAIDEGRRIEFSYRKQGATADERRRVDPHVLVQLGGRWLLQGFDLERGDERRFLLARIRGAVKTGQRGSSEHPAPADAAERARASLEALAASQRARVRVRPDTDAALRLPRRAGAEPGAELVELPFADLELLADELAGYGPEIEVLGPDALVDAVRERRAAVAAAHAPIGDAPTTMTEEAAR
ncbi:Protein PafB [Pseudoclavibacter triregionum]|nr:Protein PafB [Pseudoclavibacter triregionum]